ncbi:putative monovalent cation/H+ antiporter subunit G [Methanobrevibacter cuticularis]|uniref:Putative monovalent cation/H+ antiporter subunit G n=1 Tax=Methanobrevibacter cuticularis TaxID=47311 RepID=A0A166DJI6_9EURY|nr:hypothetical protein [Methanobrevibacter cuticularis]KZX15664.1 putative monovalent cation/H+ antiporter subunit G [Methanobrevibacter cuticularis]
MWNFAIEIIQSIFLIVAAIIILITAYGILTVNDKMDKVIYVRIHMLGMMDIACVLALIGLNQIFLGALYFVLAPLVAHAMANAYYYGEDPHKYDEDYDNRRNELSSRSNDLNIAKSPYFSRNDLNSNFKDNNLNDIPIKEINTDDIEVNFDNNAFNNDINTEKLSVSTIKIRKEELAEEKDD